MTLTIDSLTGLGPVDYTAALAADVPLKITRTLNKPAILYGLIEIGTLPIPARRGRVVVASANGTLLFTGYLAIEPVALYAGVSTTGPVYRYEISALSDEWLLDKQTFPLYKPVLATPAGTAIRALAQRVDSGLFSTTAITAGRAVGVFEPSQSAAWSSNAGELAAASYSAYRVLNGTLTLQPAGTVTHAMNFDTGLVPASGNGSGTSTGVTIAALKTASVKELANDVTLSGAIEPAAYISETFMGDGVTTVFALSESPFRPTAANRKLLTDSFNEAALDTQLWDFSDPGSHLSLGGAGLVISGGNGYDGQTSLAALDAIEIGGSLVLEAGTVLINPASQGVLLGLYDGPTSIPNCFAGFNLRQLAGATVMTPMIDGVETGTTFNVQVGHAYTLRLRLHCPEMQRVLQTFYSMGNGTVASFGGGAVSAPVTLVFEVLDQGAASNTPVTILYDGGANGPVLNSAAFCVFAPVNAAQIFGSIGYITVTQTGSAFVTSTPPAAPSQTRLIGIAGQGVDCSLSGTGKLTFFAGRVPVAGELITVAYRGSQRAVTRIQNATSIASEAATGVPGTALPGIAQWLGKVLKPPARSTADCESAALAVLSFATSRAAAVSGTCTAVNPQQLADIWPGDLLALTQNAAALSVIVRRVELTPAPSCPEEIAYKIAFANDWAEGLGLTLSDVIAADTILPHTPETTAQFATGTNAAVLANLPQLQVVSATTTALQIDAGAAPPTGGGFEVRRRDGAFGPNIAQDLVLRSPVRSFSVPREAQVERYYIRMYDASNPPLYSRLSSAVFINLPFS